MAWLEPLLADLPGLSLFDAHTHIGANDPDGARLSGEQLLAILAPLDAKWVFTFTEPHLPEGWHGVLSSPTRPGSRVIVHDG